MIEEGGLVQKLRSDVPDKVKEFKQGRDISEWARKIWEVDKYFVVALLEASEPEERELARYIVVQGPQIPRDWNSRERAKIAAIDAQIKTLVAYIEACERAPGVIRDGLMADMKYKVKVLQKVASHFDSIRGQSVLKGKWSDVELKENRAAGLNISPDPDAWKPYNRRDAEGFWLMADGPQDEPQSPRTPPMTEEEMTQALQELEAEATPDEPQEWTSQPGPEPPKKTLEELEELVEQFRPAIMVMAGSMNQLVEGVKQAVRVEDHRPGALEELVENYRIDTGFRTEDLLKALNETAEEARDEARDEDPEKEDQPAILPGQLMTPGNHYPQSPFIDQVQVEGKVRRPYRRNGETVQEAQARAKRTAEEADRPKRRYTKRQKPVFIEVARPQEEPETN